MMTGIYCYKDKKTGIVSNETKRKMSGSLKGRVSPNKKRYARIVKHGKNRGGNQRYGVNFNVKILKTSINRAELVNWFTKRISKYYFTFKFIILFERCYYA